MNRVSFKDLVNAKPREKEGDIPRPTPLPPPVENSPNPGTQIPKLTTQIPSPDTQIPKADTQIPRYPEPLREVPDMSTGYPDTQREYHYPSRKERTQTSLRLPSNKLKFYKRWCLDNDMDFQVAVEKALDDWIPRYPDTQVSGYPDTQIPTDHDHDHDDYDINHDRYRNDHHHQSVVKLYEELAGRRWTKRDDDDYEKIKNLNLDQIISLMRTVHNRPHGPIGSFNYFAKSILSEMKVQGGGRAGLRKQYEKFLREIRQTYVGSNLPVSELIDKLKTRCLRDGVAWNDDAANEALGL